MPALHRFRFAIRDAAMSLAVASTTLTNPSTFGDGFVWPLNCSSWKIGESKKPGVSKKTDQNKPKQQKTKTQQKPSQTNPRRPRKLGESLLHDHITSVFLCNCRSLDSRFCSSGCHLRLDASIYFPHLRLLSLRTSMCGICHREAALSGLGTFLLKAYGDESGSGADSGWSRVSDNSSTKSEDTILEFS